jgi:hypothetical protein
MRITDCIKKPRKYTKRKSTVIAARITNEELAWIKRKKMSIALIFRQALKELGYKGDDK